MDSVLPCFVLIALAVLLVPFALMIAHARKIKGLQTTLQKLSGRIESLEAQLRGTRANASSHRHAKGTGRGIPRDGIVAAADSANAAPAVPVSPSVAAILNAPAAAPPPLPAPPPVPRPVRPAIDWEAFMGVKLFAWVGGFVLFLAVVFLVKYSFDNNLITPAMRIIIGVVIGCGLIAAGWFTARRNYGVPGQSLCATGVLVLYADTFGAHTFYHLISLPVAFALMSLITVASFFLAVSMNAQVVVVLGLVGGFLTPLLLTTGDHPWPTFGYIALLNAGIAAVALRKRWDYLFLLAALGTVAIESLWVPIHDAQQMRLGFPICLGLQAQFLLFAWLRQRIQPNEKWSTPASALVGFASIGYVFILLSIPSLAMRPGFFFSFAFLADIGLLFLATMRPNPARIAGPAGAVVFALLAAWTAKYLEHDLLWWALGAYVVFALIHSGFTVWPKRPDAGKPASTMWHGFIPLLALVASVHLRLERRNILRGLGVCVADRSRRGRAGVVIGVGPRAGGRARRHAGHGRSVGGDRAAGAREHQWNSDGRRRVRDFLFDRRDFAGAESCFRIGRQAPERSRTGRGHAVRPPAHGRVEIAHARADRGLRGGADSGRGLARARHSRAQ